jgi:hypothetical protein
LINLTYNSFINFLLTESSLIDNGIRNEYDHHECIIIYNNYKESLEILDEKFSLLHKTKILDDIFLKVNYNTCKILNQYLRKLLIKIKYMKEKILKVCIS